MVERLGAAPLKLILQEFPVSALASITDSEGSIDYELCFKALTSKLLYIKQNTGAPEQSKVFRFHFDSDTLPLFVCNFDWVCMHLVPKLNLNRAGVYLNFERRLVTYVMCFRLRIGISSMPWCNAKQL